MSSPSFFANLVGGSIPLQQQRVGGGGSAHYVLKSTIFGGRKNFPTIFDEQIPVDTQKPVQLNFMYFSYMTSNPMYMKYLQYI